MFRHIADGAAKHPFLAALAHAPAPGQPAEILQLTGHHRALKLFHRQQSIHPRHSRRIAGGRHASASTRLPRLREHAATGRTGTVRGPTYRGRSN